MLYSTWEKFNIRVLSCSTTTMGSSFQELWFSLIDQILRLVIRQRQRRKWTNIYVILNAWYLTKFEKIRIVDAQAGLAHLFKSRSAVRYAPTHHFPRCSVPAERLRIMATYMNSVSTEHEKKWPRSTKSDLKFTINTIKFTKTGWKQCNLDPVKTTKNKMHEVSEDTWQRRSFFHTVWVSTYISR